jgi:hypothetical protein
MGRRVGACATLPDFAKKNKKRWAGQPVQEKAHQM